jgi:1-aminocyclopropane-1-carboxylate deaminase/D-cysteine desulfhydrase-like pyridoxal-dependent ACC family enzyme
MDVPVPDIDIEYTDRYVGGGYGVASSHELAIQAEASALTGAVFDPTYTGKAIAGLRSDIATGRYGRNDTVIFWHTGGGFAALSHDFTGIVAAAGQVVDSG